MVFLKEFLKNLILKKSTMMIKMHAKLPSMQRLSISTKKKDDPVGIISAKFSQNPASSLRGGVL